MEYVDKTEFFYLESIESLGREGGAFDNRVFPNKPIVSVLMMIGYNVLNAGFLPVASFTSSYGNYKFKTDF
jgi:hypothetical protein